MKFPQDATDPERLWAVLMERRCAMTEFPKNRFNIDGFHDPRNTSNTIPLRGGHFIQEDLSSFDASFFSISPAEAATLDPMQRWLLETAYHALENAGITMESVAGTCTGVYTGCFSNDYLMQLLRDAESLPTHAVTGVGLSMLANRLSWFFDFHGPSVGLDSACSSTAMGIDIACQALHAKSCNMALVAGGNLTFAPEMYTMMTNMNFLSPDSRCYSFDHRANGYARGEGVGVLVLKRLSDAIRDGNTVRAVIRATRSNEDGRTPGITQPNRYAQEDLIKQTYEQSGLSMGVTRYFEAHGTGTPIGDPIEAQAIGAAFQQYRSASDPLYVGALKSNIGHLEGASALAGVVKAVLVLEKGMIPPNTNFEKINPAINSAALNLKFPEHATKWPTSGLRRASVNSFGYGGANSHIILDDAYHYMLLRGLKGKHCTESVQPRPSPSMQDGNLGQTTDDQPPKLIVISAEYRDGVQKIAEALSIHSTQYSINDDTILGNFLFTLNSCRSHLSWRSYAILRSAGQLRTLHTRLSDTVRRQATVPRIGYVFTGQGAQWCGMGKELMLYDDFRENIRSADTYLRGLGCGWSVEEELLKPRETSRINEPIFSQSLCTILQVGIVHLLSTFQLEPACIVGHSSGEIAAAHAGGYISMESAWKLAYFRGVCSAEIASNPPSQQRGAMLSAGISEDNISKYIGPIIEDSQSFGLTVACVNSPRSVTISGEESLIDQLKAKLHDGHISTRKLRVPVAYHSRQMDAISAKYIKLVGQLSQPYTTRRLPMISSVTATWASEQLLDPSYWASNLVSPVRFYSAFSMMCTHSQPSGTSKAIDHLLEIGPHAALAGPVHDILETLPQGNAIRYTSILKRGQSASITALTAVGELYSHGVPVNLKAVNEASHRAKSSRSMLVTLPPYPFDRSKGHWYESSLSHQYRTREHAPSEFLGVRAGGSGGCAGTKWRHFLKSSELAWSQQHVLNGATLFPAGGMIVMAIEGANQITHDPTAIERFVLSDILFQNPIDLTDRSAGLEVQTTLRQIGRNSQNSQMYDFTIQTYTQKAEWRTNCHGTITVELRTGLDSWARQRTREQEEGLLQPSSHFSDSANNVKSRQMYDFLVGCGYNYGPSFRIAENQRYTDREATADVTLLEQSEASHVIHPTTLDALFHLSFTARTSGGSKPMATCVPSRIASLSVSRGGLSRPEQETIRARINISHVTHRGFSCDGVAVNGSGPQDVKLQFEALELTNVTGAPDVTAYPSKAPLFCTEVQSKVALSKVNDVELSSLLWSLHRKEEGLIDLFGDIEKLVHLSLQRLVTSFDPSCVGNSYKKRYWDWANYHLQARHGIWGNDQRFEDLIDSLRVRNHTGRLFSTIATNLVDIFMGCIEPSALLFESGILKEYYEELDNYACTERVAAYLDLSAHESPGLTILEVGGGTGAGTGKMLRALCARPDDPRARLRCSRYDFTDISPVFLNAARERFHQFESQMTFGLLDIERDFTDQGFQNATYDIILAASILHIAGDLHGALLQIRRTLRPNGKLLAQEFFDESGWILGYVFGRELSPNIPVQAWDTLLKGAGFSGIDLNLEFGKDTSYHHGWFVATAIERTPLITQQLREPCRVTIVHSSEQLNLGEKLSGRITKGPEAKISVATLEDVATTGNDMSDALIVLVVDYGEAFVENMETESWSSLQSLFRQSARVLWVSTGGGNYATPGYGLIDGLARTLRQEYIDLHLVTLALDGNGSLDSHVALMEPPYEQAYTEVEGHLHTQRLVQASYVNAEVERRVAAQGLFTAHGSDAMRSEALASHSGVYPYKKRGEDRIDDSEQEGMVDVAIKAFALRNEERPPALGVVLKASSATGFRQGDHVFIVNDQSPSLQASVSAENACWCFPLMIAAYHIVVEVLDIQRHDRLLVQGGTTPIGQAILYILGLKDGESTQLQNHTDIPPRNIVPAQWFTHRLSAPRQTIEQFDKMITADSHAVPEYMGLHLRNGGQYVLLAAPSGLTQPEIAPRTRPTRNALEYASANCGARFPASRLTKHADRLRNVQQSVTSVFELQETDVEDVQVEKRLAWTLNPDATYLVAGGLGGLGRELARWHSSRGARYLVLISRRGPTTSAALDLLTELRRAGVHVETPICDITKETELKTTLATLGESLPPIRGCMQASMVMTESMFEETPFASWKAATQPKTAGSWNLHTLLPDDLDFFVLASSVMGILGSSRLAGYNAGNTFQDALARFRVSLGQRAVSIDIGGLSDSGHIAESENLRKTFFEHYTQLTPMVVQDVLGLMDVYCDPSSSLASSSDTCHIIVGINPPSYWDNKEEAENTMPRPFWGHMYHLPPESQKVTGAKTRPAEDKAIGSVLEVARKMISSQGFDDAAALVTTELGGRLASLLGMEEDSLDPLKEFNRYGVDSLAAIELRRWINTLFNVDLPVFNITEGGATLASISRTIVSRSRKNTEESGHAR
ncbi:putative polyketide synthase [Xylariomycetidae sp. FL0641]|nr:putative polyketide synthase [Xylariomycetidae sp. FL0641]